MNPYLLLAAVVFWAASTGGAFIYGQGVGRDGEIAKHVAIDQAVLATRQAAQQGAADAIAKIKVTNTTIQGKTQTIIRENTVYRDCANTDDGVRNINEALSGAGEPARDRKLPDAHAPG